MNLISSVPLLQTLTAFHLFCCIFCFQIIFLWVFCPYVLILKPIFLFPFWLYLLQNFRHKKTTGNNCHPLKETWRSWIILSIVSVQSPLVSIVSLGVIMTLWCLIWKKSKRGEIQLEVPTQFVNNITFASQLLLAFFGNLSSKNFFRIKTVRGSLTSEHHFTSLLCSKLNWSFKSWR